MFWLNYMALAFRETLRVVFVSVVCLTVTGLLAVGLRWLAPERTVDFRGLIQDPEGFARVHHVQVIWWALALMGVATTLGAVAADRRIVQLLHRVMRSRATRWVSGTASTNIRSASAWYVAMHMYDHDNPGPVLIGAQMDDGTYVEGRLFTFNVTVEEVEDRDILLSAPLWLTTIDGMRHRNESQFMVISARHIRRLDITHLDTATTGTASAELPEQHTEEVVVASAPDARSDASGSLPGQSTSDKGQV